MEKHTHQLFLFLSQINHVKSVSYQAVNIYRIIICPLTCVINNIYAV